MTPTEKQSTLVDPTYWGIDFRALQSAVRGSKDLVKYGTLACAEELQFYQKYEVNYAHQVKRLAEQGNYIEALNLSERIFLDIKHWSEGYGREPWAKIANILKQIEEKREFLDMIKDEKASGKEPPSNYEKLEIETMKEIIVLMNVFDGLAHNSGNIMPKLMSEEIRELTPETYDPKMMERVQKMMDAKELHNPIDVYREIQHIIDQPMYKSTFGDWIGRIRQNPEYHVRQDPFARRNELKRISLKKNIITFIPQMNQILDNLIALKDRVINTHDKYGKQDYKYSFRSKLNNLNSHFGTLYHWCGTQIHYATNESPALIPYIQSVQDYAAKAREELTQIYEKLKNQESIIADNDQDVMHAAQRAKRLVSGLEGVIASA
jgi:hypothetical protein